MTDGFLAAPLAMAAAVLCVCLAIAQHLNRAGIRARRRVVTFAPSGRAVFATSELDGSVLKGSRYSSIGLLDRILRRGRGRQLGLDLIRAGSALQVGEYVLIRLVCAALAGLVVRGISGALLLGLIAAVGGWFVPKLYMRAKQTKRLQAFDNQLPDALLLIANGMKSGYSFMQGADSVAREMPQPIGPEFARALAEIRLGGEVDEALNEMYERTPTPEFDLVVTAIIIQRQVGGDLPEILGTIAQTIRERHRILGEVRVLTAQERMSGYVVAALPLVMVLALALISPHYLGGMWSSFGGRAMLMAGFAMEGVGLLIIRRIVDIPV
ncbi:MAG: type II secretion system F family protein [Chloroflexi bacterium]|nr:type II secretion system F family protein [Chloroflexota bacterium]